MLRQQDKEIQPLRCPTDYALKSLEDAVTQRAIIMLIHYGSNSLGYSINYSSPHPIAVMKVIILKPGTWPLELKISLSHIQDLRLVVVLSQFTAECCAKV